MALVDRKFVTRIIIITLRKFFSNYNFFLIRIFRTGARIRGVNNQRCEVELKSAAGYIPLDLFLRSLMMEAYGDPARFSYPLQSAPFSFDKRALCTLTCIRKFFGNIV